ncbi:DUF654-domain-containing protein [Punctularia strigosozonata HHB-11173 SS5]|uniref:DUF654-domain-containing protein n=1 Tax=Punctularia strigosozonata (strain HHB-11173) TaxID=741275 RepID=R7S3G5_PUNST|nr:DUF654-domain-containing protein [Punctularia strigosozonata HHB-11173 SS5]EIN04337.1 DUF654-domain-containing protein [Punctularia strigosozonata HHB-11173 SS5]
MSEDPVSEPGEESEDTSTKSMPAKNKANKKKKKKAPATPAPEENHPTRTQNPPQKASGSSSKSTKKAAKKTKKREDDVDELDKVLSELSVKYPDLRSGASAPSPATGSLAPLLSVSSQHLDPEAEMRKFFGSKVIASSAGEGSQSPGRRQPKHLQKSTLTKPKSTWWPPSTREGLSIRGLTESELSELTGRHGVTGTPQDEHWWTVEYSKKYKGVTLAFMQSVMSGDPENFWRLLSKLPWHADTLLQLAEAYRYREEHAQAMDFTDRALFTYERAFVGAFSLTNGVNRLDFDHIENRPFFLALHRQVSDLQRRGCFRTAFEFAKLLYSLEPMTDPHGALLHLDFLSIKSGNGTWLLDVYNFFEMHAKDENSPWRKRMNVLTLPGWRFSRALAMRNQEESQKCGHEASTKALQEAILAFPSVVPLLADRADITLSSEARGHNAFRIQADASALSRESDAILHLLSHLYAQRASGLWKTPDVGRWFASTVKASLPEFPSSPDASNDTFRTLFSPRPVGQRSIFGFQQQVTSSLAYSIYRHIVVLEANHRSLLSFLPRNVAGSTKFAGDPVPPPTSVNGYDPEFFKGAEDVFQMPRGRNSGRALEQLIPDPVFRQQIQGFFDAHPHVAERFPGGINQFVQALAQLPPEVIEDMLIQAADGADIGPGLAMPQDRGMPGDMEMEVEVQWANFGEDGQGMNHGRGDDDDDETDEEQGATGMNPLGMLRGLVNGLWGNNTGVDDDDDDDADREHGDRH